MKKVVIIPARYNSTRLPGKPLLDIQGKPMIVRVCESVDVAHFDRVVVATDNEKIAEAVQNAGFEAVMTREDHVSGTDRLHEAAMKLNLSAEDIVINLQGDEPLMPSDNLHQVSKLLSSDKTASVATLYELTADAESRSNSNIVKLVQAQSNKVLYFSRAGIPFNRDNIKDNQQLKRHVGIYAYRKSALDAFVTYPEGELESLEKLEQLRFMENGHTIVAAQADLPIPVGVDTQEDLDKVRSIFSGKIS